MIYLIQCNDSGELFIDESVDDELYGLVAPILEGLGLVLYLELVEDACYNSFVGTITGELCTESFDSSAFDGGVSSLY